MVETKDNALHFFLTKRGHLAMCLRDIPESDGNCTCGYDAAQAELTKLKALAALAEDVAGWLRGDPTHLHPIDLDWLSRYNAITKDGGK